MATLPKYLFATLLVASSFATRPAVAQDPLIGVDGCGILAILVYTEVTDTDMSRSKGPGGAFALPYRNEITICNRAARTITRAFSKSMQQLNIFVSWGPYDRGNGDYCDSHYLDQCYPGGSPSMPPLSDAQSAHVRNSWLAIRMALDPTLRHGVEGDVARFENRDLELGLRHSLGRNSGFAHSE